MKKMKSDSSDFIDSLNMCMGQLQELGILANIDASNLVLDMNNILYTNVIADARVAYNFIFYCWLLYSRQSLQLPTTTTLYV